MIEEHEIDALMSAVSDVTREFVAKSAEPLTRRIEEVNAHGANEMREMTEVFCKGLRDSDV